MITWLSENIVEVFGAVTGIAYVILEIRRNISSVAAGYSYLSSLYIRFWKKWFLCRYGSAGVLCGNQYLRVV